MWLNKALNTKQTKTKSSTNLSHSINSPFSPTLKRSNFDYENIYPSAHRIETTFAKQQPYGIDSKGEKVHDNLVNRLYFPNQSMDHFRFRQALASMYLTHDEFYIRIWHSGETPINPDNITGFTFLQNVTPKIHSGKKHFYISSTGETITSDEVITIPSGTNPFWPSSGISPARAARRWTNIDDYLADYQSAFFRNGAVPAGQFTITAPTVDEFESIKDAMKSAHKGADKVNNVVYSHRPTDEDGQPNAATVEWTPFDQKNKDLAIKEIHEIIEDKIDKTFGVPAEVQGKVSNSNYSSVRVAQQIFMEYVIEPMTTAIWATFTHEMNRVTGALGYAITCKVEIPQVEDEELVKAQKKQTEAETILSLVNAGYTLESAVKALGLPQEYSELSLTDTPEPEDEEEEIERPDGELPVQDPDIARTKYVNIGTVNVSSTEEAEKFIETISKDRETEPENEEELWERDVRRVAQQRLDEHVESVLNDLDSILERGISTKQVDPTDEDDDEYKNKLLAVLAPILAIRGQREYQRGEQMFLEAGIDATGLVGWEMTEAMQNRYSNYLGNVANSYNADTADKIRRTLSEAQAEGLPVGEIRAKLNQLPEAEGYRAERLSRSEVHRTQGKGSVEAMREIQEQTGYKVEKIWRVGGPDPCEFCLAMDGTVVGVDENFIDLNQTITGTDGGEYTNTFTEEDTASAHPNDQCRIEYRIGEQL